MIAWRDSSTVPSIRSSDERSNLIPKEELANGPIPDGQTIDHVRKRGCVMRNCCNVNHMEVVTLSENGRRGAEARWGQKAGQ